MFAAPRALVSFGLVCGCFHPAYDHPACSSHRECPPGLVCNALGRCDVPMDASMEMPDASFDVASCPTSYNTSLPGPSRYRLIPAGYPAWEQSDACAADLPGATHLVVLETLDEIQRVAALVNAPPTALAGNAVWIGAVQQRTAVQPGEGWLWFDGAPLTDGWTAGEPNDRDGSEVDHEEQFIALERNKTYFNDSTGSNNVAALCECDGKPIAPVAVAAIAANRP